MSGVAFNISALDKTGKAFQSVNNRMTGMKNKLGGLKGAFGGLKVAILGAFTGAALKAVASFVDVIQKTSIRLGIATEALSEYAFVAELSGVSQEALTNGIKKLGINISNAEKGLKAQSDALSDLGLKSQDLISLPLDKQFEIVADRIKGVSNQSDKLRIAQDLLGRSGTELLTVFDSSSESISQMRSRAKELNATISGETANAIAGMNDSWTEVVTALRGVGVAILDFFAPTLTFLLKKIADVIAFVGDLWEALKFARDSIAAASIRFQEFVGLIDKDTANEAIKEIADRWRNVKNEVSDSTTEVKKLKGAMNGLSKTTAKEVKNEVVKIKKETEDSAISMKDTFKDALGGITTEFKSLKEVAMDTLSSISNALLRRSTDSLVDQLFSKKGPLGGDLNVGNIFSGIGDMFGGFFADGGTLRPGQWGIAGERGPEPIFAGNAPLTVVPNQQGGRPLNVQVNISTPDVNNFRRSQGQISAALAESVRRGSRNL